MGDSLFFLVFIEKLVVKCVVYLQYGFYFEFDILYGDGYDLFEVISKVSSNINSKYSSYSINIGYSIIDYDSFFF